MRIEDAQVFLKLAETRSVRKAAEQSGLTQSAATKVLQRLEQQFDMRLAERASGGLQLTDAGRLLQTRCLELVLSADNLHREMGAASAAQRGTVRVGTVPALLDSHLLPVLAQSHAQRPDISLQVSVKVSDELSLMVQTGQLDLAICFLPVASDELQWENLGPQRYHVVVRPGHPLAAPGQATMRALSQAKWLLPGPQVAMRQWIEQSFLALKLPLPRTVVQTDWSTAFFGSLVRSCDLVTALMTPNIRGAQTGEWVELPFKSQQRPQELGLMFRRTAYLSPAAMQLRQAIHRAFAQKPRHASRPLKAGSA